MQKHLLNKYNPYKSPFDLKLALDHSKAVSTHPYVGSMNKSYQLCPCCRLPIRDDKISMCANENQFKHLGIAFPMYFKFIKQCMQLLILQMLVSGFANLYFYGNGHTCSKASNTQYICSFSFLNISSSQRKGEKSQDLQFACVINMISLVVIVIFTRIIQIKQQNQSEKLEMKLEDISQYSLLMTGLNRNEEVNIYEIKSTLAFLQKEIEVININKIYDLKQYEIIQKEQDNAYQQKNKIKARIRKIKDSDVNKHIAELEYLNNSKKLIVSHIKKLAKEIKNFQLDYQSLFKPNIREPRNLQNLNQFSGKIIITINDSQHVQNIIRLYNYTLYERFQIFLIKKKLIKDNGQIDYRKFQGQIVKFRKCYSPSDIIWYNIGQKKNKTLRKLLFTFIIIGIFIGSLTLIVKFKKSMKLLGLVGIQSMLVSFFVSTIVAITNSLLGIVLRKFSGLETHNSQSSYFKAVGVKLTWMFFFNMVLATLFSNAIGSFTETVEKYQFPLDLHSFFNDCFFLFITMQFLGSFFSIFDIVWGYKLLKRWYHKRLGKYTYLSQNQANKLFEGHPVDMALRYANIIKAMFFTAFSPMFPLGAVMSFLGLIVAYNVDKYLIVSRFVCSNRLSYGLSEQMVRLIQYYGLFYAISNFIIIMFPVFDENAEHSNFHWPTYNKNPEFYFSIISLIYSGLGRHFPQSWIRNAYSMIYSDNDQSIIIYQKLTYKQCVENKLFKSDYSHYSPVANPNIGNQSSIFSSAEKYIPDIIE